MKDVFSNISWDELKTFLDEKVDQYNRKTFIESDPISIPHTFFIKEDIEISGFLTATISWGARPQIIRAAKKMMELMGNAPYDFVMEAGKLQMSRLDDFVYRTFQSNDFTYFIMGLRHIYANHGGMEAVFTRYATSDTVLPAIHAFRSRFFEIKHPFRTEKHISDPNTGSASKRINMYLRWMIRSDKRGVDFGIWKKIKPAQLSCPLDVHSGNVARKLGLIQRKQNDSKALAELDSALRSFDPIDPVKYDFALFGLGVFEKF